MTKISARINTMIEIINITNLKKYNNYMIILYTPKKTKRKNKEKEKCDPEFGMKNHTRGELVYGKAHAGI